MSTQKLFLLAMCIIMLSLIAGESFSNRNRANTEQHRDSLYAHCIENASVTNTDAENCKKILDQ